MSGNKPIIVKKIKKNGGGHHGGAWKVAYADFVTAMMAFFLLMWLLNMTSDEKRVRLSQYFKHFSIYDKGGTSFMGKTSEIFGESGESKQKAFTDRHVTTVENAESMEPALNGIVLAIEKDVAEKLGDTKDQVIIDEVDEGIRIQIIDKDGSLMFEQGSTNLASKGKEVLKVISSDIKELPNKIVIEGHTDSLPYSKSGYSNWELSTERALSARKELEKYGIDTKRIARVTGFADSDPLIKEDPSDARNRRISIIIQHMKKINKAPVPKENDEDQLIIDVTDIDKLKSANTPIIIIKDSSAFKEDKERSIHISEGPVIKSNDMIQNQQGYVIDNEWSPVINNTNGGKKRNTLIQKYMSSPAVNKETTDTVIKENKPENNLIISDDIVYSEKKSRNVLKSKNNKKSYTSTKTSRGPSVIEELSNPVISNDWSPVINK